MLKAKGIVEIKGLEAGASAGEGKRWHLPPLAGQNSMFGLF